MDDEKEQFLDDKHVEQCSKSFDQSIMLITQVFNSLSHRRWDNILTVLMDSPVKVKETLNNQTKVLDSPTNQFLFGDDFEAQLVKEAKSIKQSDGLFTGLKTSKSKATSSSHSNAAGSLTNQPFSKGSLSRGRGRGLISRKNSGGFNNFHRGKKSFYSSTSTEANGLSKSPSSNKGIVSSETNSRLTTNRKAEVAYLSLKIRKIFEKFLPTG